MNARFLDRPVDAVLLDLDGTLLDTFNDIALALSRACAEHGIQAPDASTVRTMIGRGAPMLVERATQSLGLALDASRKAAIVERFFHHYGQLQENDECGAQPFPGVPEGLRALHAAGLPLAIVTNKQQRFAEGLLRRLSLAPWLQLVVGGDTCERRKPDPQPLLWASSQLGSTPDRTVMVGDSVNDVVAARAAGMRVICVPYGYNEGQDSRSLPCDAFVESLADLPSLLGV